MSKLKFHLVDKMNYLYILWKSLFDFFFNQVNEFLAMTDEQKTALKWQFLLERSKIHLKVSVFYSTMLFYIFKQNKALECDIIN